MSDYRGGYAGQFLRVDLDTGAITCEPTPDPALWLGPRGWNALIGWREVGHGVGPFDPENRLVFSSGALVGTCAPAAGRMTVSSLMPVGYPTPMWASASMGGYLGAELKYAGYDGIIVQGRAERPCYLLIQDDQVSLVDADHLWGLGALTTQQRLKEHYTKAHQIATIGPAGENRVRFASIIHRLANAVGNGGLGGVMGSKNLKAIVVRGTGVVPVAEPEQFLATVQDVWRLAKGGVGSVGQIQEGYPNVACSSACSLNCGTRITSVPGRYPSGSQTRMLKCNNNAPVGGSHTSYEGEFVDGTRISVPRSEGLGELGLDIGNEMEELGLTTWFYSTWGRYCNSLQELGIHDIEGEAIHTDDPDWWHTWLQRIAYRQGLGDDLAEGLSRFYVKHPIGPAYLLEIVESKGSRGHGWHREGRSMEAHPSPYWEYAALLYAVSTRDVTPSTHGFFFLNGLYGYPERPKDPAELPAAFKRLAKDVYGSEQAIYPGDAWIEHVSAWHQARAIIKDSMGVCDWAFPVVRRTMDTREDAARVLADPDGNLIGDLAAEARLHQACTGMNISIHEMETPIAERIINLERCIEVRNNGRCRDDDELVIPHFQWSEKTDGTHISADAHEFKALLDRYYDLRGWDRATGRPIRQRLVALGLDEAADQICATEKAPVSA